MYIPWLSWIRDPYHPIQGSPKPKGSVFWRDKGSGTYFYLLPGERSSILAAGQKKLNACAGIDQQADYLCGQMAGLNEHEQAFVQMPFALLATETGEVQQNRLCDILSLRTGLLYALMPPDKSYCMQMDQQKKRLRETALFSLFDPSFLSSSPAPYPECNALLQEIDATLIHGGVSSEKPFDLVRGGATKIKEYYLETDTIRDMRGASLLLDEVNRIRLPAWFAKEYIPESIVYAGGGSLMAIVPRGEGERAAIEIERFFEMVTITCQCVATTHTTTLASMGTPKLFSAAMKELQLNCTTRQMAKLDGRESPQPGDIRYGRMYTPENDYQEAYLPPLQSTSFVLCDRCRMRKAVHSFFMEGYETRQPLCVSCAHKELAGGRKGRLWFREACIAYHQEKHPEAEEMEEFKANTVGELADSEGQIGVLYGDGNNMGSAFIKTEGLVQLRFLSMKTSRAMEGAVYGALSEKMVRTKFELIALGGDDLFLIVPGKIAPSLAASIGRRFDCYFLSYDTDNGHPITLSVGLCVASQNTPIQLMSRMCDQLLKSAKRYARRLAEFGRSTGTMDLLQLSGDSAWCSSLSLLRMPRRLPGGKESASSIRPFTWAEYDSFEQVAAFVTDNRLGSTCYAFRTAVEKMSPLEAKLFFQKELVREETKKHGMTNAKMLVKKIYDLLELRHKTSVKSGLYFEYDEGKFCSPWADLVELSSLVGGQSNE